MDEVLRKKLKKVKMVVLDADGVLTDGKVTFDDTGREWCSFDVKDGFGVRALIHSGVIVAVISGRMSEVVKNRAAMLGIKEIYIGVKEKRHPYRELLKRYGLKKEEVAYVADDVYDLPLMKEVGISIAVADSVEDVLREADYVTRSCGGRGAVREVAEAVLKEKGLWDGIVAILFDEKRRDNL
ncbi:MAG: HAD-IIIA family hydrolase [Planctomycetota bacterium]|nr:HAD-IIIA family hydrolase [Planctomycetota bacterium]